VAGTRRKIAALQENWPRRREPRARKIDFSCPESKGTKYEIAQEVVARMALDWLLLRALRAAPEDRARSTLGN